MNTLKKGLASVVIFAIVVIAGLLYYYFLPKKNTSNVPAPQQIDNTQTTQQNELSQLPNKIDAIYKASLTDAEKDQVVKSVDAFMNKYKLPKGDLQNSYVLLVERRLNNALKVITNPEQDESDFHAIIYLRKIDGTWQVDENARPWCTLEEFEQNKCE